MNPNWIVIRERPWLTPGPLKTGAAEVTCYGLHVRVRSTGRIRLTASYPDSTILHKDTGPADVWPDLLDWMATPSVWFGWLEDRRVLGRRPPIQQQAEIRKWLRARARA